MLIITQRVGDVLQGLTTGWQKRALNSHLTGSCLPCMTSLLGSAAGLQPEAHEPCSAWGQSPVLASEALLGDLRILSVEGQFRTGLQVLMHTPWLVKVQTYITSAYI